MELQHGWWLMCLVMAGYYTIVIYLIPGYVGSELTSTILKPAISLLMVGFYAILLFFFSRIRREAEARNNAQLAALQLSALQSRMEAVKAAEDIIRTERHDLRHRIQAVMEMVARGEEKSALDFLDATQRRLDEHKLIRWCRPPVLNAVFSSYFDQAQNQDIPVEADISLPTPSRWTKESLRLSWQTPWKMPSMPISCCPRSSGRSGAGWWGLPALCWSFPIHALTM